MPVCSHSDPGRFANDTVFRISAKSLMRWTDLLTRASLDRSASEGNTPAAGLKV